jgi:hypothetical protein
LTIAGYQPRGASIFGKQKIKIIFFWDETVK